MTPVYMPVCRCFLRRFATPTTCSPPSMPAPGHPFPQCHFAFRRDCVIPFRIIRSLHCGVPLPRLDVPPLLEAIECAIDRREPHRFAPKLLDLCLNRDCIRIAHRVDDTKHEPLKFAERTEYAHPLPILRVKVTRNRSFVRGPHWTTRDSSRPAQSR